MKNSDKQFKVLDLCSKLPHLGTQEDMTNPMHVSHSITPEQNE